MNKIRIVFLLILIMFVSGCKIRSNIKVSTDGTVFEKVIITERKENEDKTDKDYSKYLDQEIKSYMALIKYGDYSYKKIINDEYFGIEFYKKHDNICSYFSDTLFNQYIYRHIDCSEGDNFIVIENDTPFMSYNDLEDYSNPPNLSDVQLSISFPVSVYENNADEQKDNTYIWKFNSIEDRDKNFVLKIDKNKLIEANVNKQNEDKKNETRNIAKIILIIFSGLIIISIIILYLYKKYKENKLEY